MSNALVLVVEDNERSAKLLRDVLEHCGYRTLVARTGEEGVAMARQHLPALILMDIQLPGISGIEALQQIRAHPATRDILVVAVTASAMLEQRAQIEGAGFDGYQPKPIRVMEFLAEVQALVGSGVAGS